MDSTITPEEIKAIRGRYGLSQQSFARLLGIGEASMVRYENGQKPTKANANLIRAANHPAFMAECLERDGGLLSEAQRGSVEKVVYALVEFSDEGEVMDINEMYSLTLEQEILNEKAAEIIAEISELLFAAEERGDDVARLLYEDAFRMAAQAKGRIVRDADGDREKIAEVRGSLEAIERLVVLGTAKAA